MSLSNKNYNYRQVLLGFGYIRENFHKVVSSDVALLIVEFSKICLDSNILNLEEQRNLIDLIEQQPETKHFKNCEWKLLCSGKKHGMHQKAFHAQCDGQKNTVCILDAKTGFVCGGYASSEWKSTNGNVQGKDDNSFLFVVKPVNKMNVFHRKRNENGSLVQPNCGILYNKGDGFNFGYNTMFWGNYATDPEVIHVYSNQNYFTKFTREELVGSSETGYFKDYEVFQLLLNCEEKK